MRVAWLITLLLDLPVQESAAPAPPAAAGPVGATDLPLVIQGLRPPVERDDPGRAARLAAQGDELATLLAAMEAHGQEEAWIADAKRRYQEWDAAHPGEPGYVTAGEWTLTTALLRAISLASAPKTSGVFAPKEDGTFNLLLTLVDLDRQFAARGIDFLVVSVPSKLSIHPEITLPDLPAAGFAGMGATVARHLLNASRAGVETLSLTPAFVAARGAAPIEPLYLKSDPHWTVRGTELAAEQVAARLRAYPWFKPGPLKEGRQFRVREGEVKYTAGTELSSKGARDEVMQGRAVLVAARTSTGDEPFEAVDDKSPILVFGDSYTRVHHEQGADFVSHLARAIGRRIDCVYAANGGQREVRQKLARRDLEAWKGKRLVIWLLPDQLAIAPIRVEPLELFAGDGG
ncbi:MAG: hypothetical protein FJ293_05440 [Planctomycetes bacterium]|nr:hypothetical protein [Planctomycetota bacterium]